MPEFIYTAQDEAGQKISGRLESADKPSAMKALSEKYALVTRLDEVLVRGWRARLGFGGGIRGEDLLAFTYQLSSCLGAGLPLKRTLDLVVEESSSVALRRVALDISAGVSAGTPLSRAMAAHSEVFDRFYVSVVEAGEASGRLSELMDRLARHLETSENLRKKVQAALYYPCMVAGFALAVVAFIIVFGVPRIDAVYQGLGGELPVATRALVGAAKFLSATWPLWLGALVLSFLLARRVLGTEGGGLWLDGLKLRLGPLGDLFRDLATARFCRTFGMLYSSGVPVLEALRLAAPSVGNRVFEKAVMDTLGPLGSGEDLALVLRQAGVFPGLALGMMASGQESGTLEKMLGSLADFYDVQTEIRLQAAAGLIEPSIMIVVGIAIGGIVVFIGLPFMNIVSVLQ